MFPQTASLLVVVVLIALQGMVTSANTATTKNKSNHGQSTVQTASTTPTTTPSPQLFTGRKILPSGRDANFACPSPLMFHVKNVSFTAQTIPSKGMSRLVNKNSLCPTAEILQTIRTACDNKVSCTLPAKNLVLPTGQGKAGCADQSIVMDYTCDEFMTRTQTEEIIMKEVNDGAALPTELLPA